MSATKTASPDCVTSGIANLEGSTENSDPMDLTHACESHQSVRVTAGVDAGLDCLPGADSAVQGPGLLVSGPTVPTAGLSWDWHLQVPS